MKSSPTNTFFIMSLTMFPILICGLLGGFATIFGKLAFSSDSLPITEFSKMCTGYTLSNRDASLNCEYSIIFVRVLAGGFMLACNALVVGFFLRAIEANNTVVVIVISSATNFLTSGIFGQLMFGEVVGQSWYLGSLLIVIGMLLVSCSQGSPDKVVEQNTASSKKDTSTKRLLGNSKD